MPGASWIRQGAPRLLDDGSSDGVWGLAPARGLGGAAGRAEPRPSGAAARAPAAARPRLPRPGSARRGGGGQPGRAGRRGRVGSTDPPECRGVEVGGGGGAAPGASGQARAGGPAGGGLAHRPGSDSSESYAAAGIGPCGSSRMPSAAAAIACSIRTSHAGGLVAITAKEARRHDSVMKVRSSRCTGLPPAAGTARWA
jgi:hypothetical protein